MTLFRGMDTTAIMKTFDTMEFSIPFGYMFKPSIRVSNLSLIIINVKNNFAFNAIVFSNEVEV